MKIHCFQHVAFETLGYIETWLTSHKHTISYTKFFNSNYSFPKTEEFDALIVMGGPMSVNDENIYPWLKEEKKNIEASILANKPVLGICLGAQLIAEVLGSKIIRNEFKEIGWYPVNFIEDNELDLNIKDSLTVFHWHGETFNLPKGASLIAESKACKNQAFLYKKNVLGLQFHIEATEETTKQLIKHCSDELVDNKPYIQSDKQIISGTKKYSKMANEFMNGVLDNLLNGKF